MKILITGGNSAVALKLLKAFNKEEVILADYGDVPQFASNNYKMMSLGVLNKDIIAHHLLNICLDENIDFIVPLHHFEVEPLGKAAVLFKEFNIKLGLPSFEKMNLYFKSEKNLVTSPWLVIEDGAIKYASLPQNEFADLVIPTNLNGVFYVDLHRNLNLITI